MSLKSAVHSRAACCALLAIAALPLRAAADQIAFDRPGIPFATSTLGTGGLAWEQGLPDLSWDRSDGGIQREYDANTLLRLGLSQSVELQLSTDTQVWEHNSGADALRGHGRGSTALGIKVALPSGDDAFSWALLAQADVASGSTQYGSDDRVRALGLSTTWALQDQHALTLYAQLAHSRAGNSWTFAPNYTFISGQTWQAYVEAGIGHGEQSTRGAGGGIAWALGDHAQLDVSFLRGIASDAPDWQGGIGISVGFQ